MVDLLTELCTVLPGVGDKTAKVLAKLGIKTLFDLLYYLPVSYENRQKLLSFDRIMIGEEGVFFGTVYEVKETPRYAKITITDGLGFITLVFFHFRYFRQYCKPGKTVVGFGKGQLWNGKLVFVHPEIQFREFRETTDLGIFPIYSLTRGLTQNNFRKLIGLAIDKLASVEIDDGLSLVFRKALNLPDLKTTLNSLHFPSYLPEEITNTQEFKRLVYEELLIEWLINKRKGEKEGLVEELQWQEKVALDFFRSLPFKLTIEQNKVIQEIKADFTGDKVMHRVLQGDVGSGKTVIAALFLRMTVANQKQGALIAPTTLLARQHYDSFCRWFPSIRIVFLGGKLSLTKRKLIYQQIKDGEIELVVGTHAVLEDTVSFKNLGLVVIDEQHRFGVGQRLKMLKKGEQVHQLMMSATPIPRSLAMILCGNLTCSQLLNKPATRQPIKTILIDNSQEAHLLKKVVNYCARGGQVYWVCPLIEGTHENLMSVETRFSKLKNQIGIKTAILHGKMSDEEKERVLQAFLNKKYDLLVTTTVIEVGIDITNANLIIIENPECYGLVQLHQLRGRVGRGEQASFCVLLLGKNLSLLARKRLFLLKNEENGWVLANQDLNWRGPGDFLGYQQSGYGSFKFFRPWADTDLCKNFLECQDKLNLEDIEKEILLKRWLGDKFNSLELET